MVVRANDWSALNDLMEKKLGTGHDDIGPPATSPLLPSIILPPFTKIGKMREI